MIQNTPHYYMAEIPNYLDEGTLVSKMVKTFLHQQM